MSPCPFPTTITTTPRAPVMKLDNFYHLVYSVCLHLYCYIHNISANVSFGLLLMCHVEHDIFEEGRCEYNNRVEDNSPTTLNDKT